MERLNPKLEYALSRMNARACIVSLNLKQQGVGVQNLHTTYSNEALNARKLLEKNLDHLKSGSKILEVGGGILALSLQLASEGYSVSAVEPISEGFDHLKLQDQECNEFNFINSKIEDTEFNSKFNFAFSINVMEHVTEIEKVLNHIMNQIDDQGSYRIFCPNYDFPYEPHFGKFIFRRKKRSFYLSRKKNLKSTVQGLNDRDLLESINFITFKKLSTICHLLRYQIAVNKNAFYEIVLRSSGDIELKKRHLKLQLIVQLIIKLKVHKILKYVPVAYQPVIDVDISRN